MRSEIKAKRARESLIANREQVLLSKELVTIRTDVGVEAELEESEACRRRTTSGCGSCSWSLSFGRCWVPAGGGWGGWAGRGVGRG